MMHVFISYSKKNRGYARTLADHLLRLGFDVWIDDRIDYGEMWERTIFKAIDDCSAFLIIMTPDSYQSDWVLREIQYADRRRKPQFPVLLDGEDFPRYGPHQHVDVRDGKLPPDDFYERLEQAAPRKTRTGVNVTPAEAAISPTDTLPKTPAASPVPNHSVDKRLVIGVSAGVIVLVAIALLLSRQSPAENQIKTLVIETATLRQEVTQLSTLLTSEKTAEVASVPTTTKTNTAVPSPSLTTNPTRTITPTPSPSLTATASSTRTPTPKPTATYTATATVTRTPTATPTIDIVMAVNTLDAEATIHVRETNVAATATERAARTATATSWTDTPTPTATLTPNITASIEAFLTQRAAQTATAIAAFQTATADAWTDTPTPTPTFTNTPTPTPTFTNTPTPTFTLTPTPSPTAQGGGTGQIAFDSNHDGNTDIYGMKANGTDLRRLTIHLADDNSPAWSPDGSQIAFHSDRDGDYEIYVMNADGSDPHNLSNNPSGDYEPAWSPDGSQIAFRSNRDGNYEIYVMSADGSDPHNLSNNPSGDYEPAWSPDGSQIAFHSDRDGDYEIYVMNADGSNPHNLSNNPSGDYEPAWSPDGNQIAFRSYHDGNYEIYVMNADGSNPHNLTSNAADDYSPAWSPDGNQIAFRSNRDGHAQIYGMNADGSDPHNISNSPNNDVNPQWRAAAPNPDPLLNVPVIDTTQSPTRLAIVATAKPSSTPEPTYSVDTYLLQFSHVIFHVSNYQRINARSGPGSEFPVTGGADPNSKGAAIRLSTDGNWVYAYLSDINYFGWVNRNFISVEQGDLYDLPRSNK